jgi:hypothetical protein
VTSQINFKLDESNKASFELSCHKQDLEMARCLRALTIAISQNQIPSKILKKALKIEADLYPETRGRKAQKPKIKFA